MNKNIISSLLIALAMCIGFSSCEDMLQANNERHGDINAVVSDTLYGYWGILKSIQNLGERYVILGECRGDLVDATEYVSDSIYSILNFERDKTTDGSNRYLNIADYYHVINSCNAFLAKCDTLRTDGRNREIMIKEYAQVCAVRAWIYLQLVQVYGEVPYITKPMLSTAEMEDFWANSEFVNATNLKDKEVVTKLIEVRNTPIPNYGYYGSTSSTQNCHSTQCVFPANLVLGDIYLLEGSKASCAQAAQYYYDFLNTIYGGCPTDNQYCAITRDRQNDINNYINSNWLSPFRSISEVSSGQETVTVIPSATNKLWGTVQHGVNELFGYVPSISVQTNGTDTASTTNANVSLERDYKHQLVLSENYKQLGDAQVYEFYNNGETDEVKVMENGGDARVRAMREQDENENGDLIEFVTKQNPYGRYSTTYPVIYRKSNIWLRFAEAINRAGFPGYAFGILKCGMVNNPNWVPTDSVDFIDIEPYYYADVQTDSTTTTRLEYSSDVLLLNALLEGGYYTDTLEAMNAIQYSPEVYAPWPDEGLLSLICNHISIYEMHRAKSTPWLNFNTQYFNGTTNSDLLMYRDGYDYTTENYAISGNTTTGIHSRGCGRLLPRDRNTSFNYVNQVNRMLQMHEGYAEADSLTRAEIYDPANEELVIKAIEDLICDEMALETGVEGNRFFDLMRMARHRNDNDFLAKRVAMRTGTMNAALRSKLQSESYWYLPCPVRK